MSTFETGNVTLDVLVQHFGSVVVLWPRTTAAQEWFDLFVETTQSWGAGTVCEPAYAQPIVDALELAGFEVEAA